MEEPEWELQVETLEIIFRRCPELKGKSIEEIRKIIQAEYPSKRIKPEK